MKDWEFRPARDQGLAPAERLRSVGREPGLGSTASAALWRAATRAYLRAVHALVVEGRAHLPAEPPFVMVGNHGSHLDAIALAAALPPRLAYRAFALAAGDTFFASDATAAFAAYAINALPVWRGGSAARDLPTLRARLIEDRAVLVLFPEGTRSRTGAMGPFRRGIGALVAGTPAPVVPCWIEGAHAAWPPSSRLPRPGKLRIRIGPPLHFADATPDRAGTDAVASACERAVRALS